MQNKQLEIQAQNNRLHGQTQKVQQLQAQLNDEIINGHKLREEQSALLVQRQQLECRLAQTQETDGIIAQLRNEIQELKNQHNQLGMDLHALGEQNMAEKEGHQNFIAQLKHQLAAVKNDAAAFQQELEQKNDLLRQQEVSNCFLSCNVIRFMYKIRFTYLARQCEYLSLLIPYFILAIYVCNFRRID